jgi:hypothetical protein
MINLAPVAPSGAPTVQAFLSKMHNLLNSSNTEALKAALLNPYCEDMLHQYGFTLSACFDWSNVNDEIKYLWTNNLHVMNSMAQSQEEKQHRIEELELLQGIIGYNLPFDFSKSIACSADATSETQTSNMSKHRR